MSYFQETNPDKETYPDFDGPYAPIVTNYFGPSSFKGQPTDIDIL